MGEPTKFARRKTKRNFTSPQDEARILHYIEMRTGSDPVAAKVSIPSKRQWRRQFYRWRTAINSYYGVANMLIELKKVQYEGQEQYQAKVQNH